MPYYDTLYTLSGVFIEIIIIIIIIYVHARACTSREAPRFLALGQQVFLTTAAYSFVFAVWGAIKVASLYENYLLVLSTATKMA